MRNRNGERERSSAGGPSASRPFVQRYIFRGGVSRALFFLGLFVAVFAAMATSGGFGIATQVAAPLLTSSEDARDLFGASDAGSYLQAALGLRDLGPWGVGGNQWVYNLWPPGMVALNLLFLGVEALLRIPYLLVLTVAIGLFWAFVLERVFTAFEELRRGLGVAFLVALLLSSIGSPMIAVWIGYADGIGAGFFLLAVVELLRWDPSKSEGRAAIILKSAVFVALAMHFRATFETLATFLFLASALVVGGMLTASLFGDRSAKTRLEWGNPFVMVLSVATVAQFLSLPWRVIAGVFVRPGDFRWATILDTSWSARWLPTERYSDEASFLKNGHANYGCLNDPARCSEIEKAEIASGSPYTGGGAFSQDDFRNELVASFFREPLAYFLERTSMFFTGFFSTTGGAIGDFRFFEGLLLLVAFIWGIVVLAKRGELWNPGLLMGLVSVAGLSAVILVFHMETRYLLPIKLLMLVLALYALGQVRNPVRVIK